ncbi:MAG TPA: glycosyltransferase family 87 protein [Rhizomicrobium sp.]|jgi:hypothetical protein
MTTMAPSPPIAGTRSPDPALPNLLFAIGAGTGLAFVVSLTILCGMELWNYDGHGHPIVNDFVSFWSAGQLALHGHPAAAYDPVLRHAAEIATVGHPFPDIIGWWYPPLFLFVASALAALPYALAFNVMNDVTLVFYAATMAIIAKQPKAAFLAVLPPWAMLGMVHGQTQFLTATLIGGALLAVERRPIVAGLLLGLLSYKPQLGLLFPIALACGGYWRAFGWSCIGVGFWTLLAGAMFGFDSYVAFFHGLSIVSDRVLATNHAYWPNLQSVYGLTRWLGAANAIAWSLQIGFSLACIAIISWLWRSDVPFDLKAAALAIAAALVTPYIFVYDLTVLSVAIAFLFRHGPFNKTEYAVLATAMIAVAIFGGGRAHPIGLLACALLAGIVWKRFLAQRKGAASRALRSETQKGILPCPTQA